MGCSVALCFEPVHARGLCSKHYSNFRRIGKPTPDRRYERHSGVRREATELERAYFAGYFDGEGCVQVAPRTGKSANGYYARIDFGQTNPVVLYAMESVYGGSIITRPGASPKHRPQTRWRLAQISAVRKFLQDIAPFCREKREQVDAVLARFFADQSDIESLVADLSAMKRRAYGPHATA